MAAAKESSTEPLLASVLDKLGEEIVSGTMPTGHTFTLQDLSTRFGISRTVAREAMRALEQLGLVSSSRRVGIRVLPPENWAVLDRSVIAWRLASAEQRNAQITSLDALRTAVEPVAARLAAAHAEPEHVARLKEIAAQLVTLSEEGAGNTPEFLDIDKEFHTLLLVASGNEMFKALAEPIMNVLEGRTRYGIMPDDPAVDTMRIHVDLANQIAAGNAKAAEDASRRLLSGISEFMEY
ncbi:FCD domain-containing protein [Corynebacterium sp. Q4381]|uniref:FadR/GntR family transcriptional regulator n=1 Tax=Corynebacterium sp. Marseille-Q4381 TaxID=3121597 RepID=UPI002FE680CC